MDAYQYFFDAEGNQTGYEEVGQMEWHAKPTHQHWHFEDFARYRLLKADKTKAVRSEGVVLPGQHRRRRLTVPGAEWKPENTDLRSACGDHDTLSHPRGARLGLGRHLHAVPRRPVVQPSRACRTAATTWRSRPTRSAT